MNNAPPIFNVFQPGLKRGAATLAYAPHKKYFYVEHPTEGWRVYLRSACFLHEMGAKFDASRFLIVKRYGASPEGKVWEPPKGQMEGKDGLKKKTAPLLEVMSENIRREVAEEAKVEIIHGLTHTGLVFQGKERDYPDNHYFQYHVWQGSVSMTELNKALQRFIQLHAQPKAWERMRKDVREKDAIAWYDPRNTGLMGRWSPSIVAMYLAEYDK